MTSWRRLAAEIRLPMLRPRPRRHSEIGVRHRPVAMNGCGQARRTMSEHPARPSRGSTFGRTLEVIAEKSKAPVIAVRTKADLVATSDESFGTDILAVSTKTGIGLRNLLDTIDAAIADNYGQVDADLPMLTSARHTHALGSALAEIKAFGKAWREEKLPAPVASVHLRAAVHALEELIGGVDVEDIFDQVFKTFCVGK